MQSLAFALRRPDGDRRGGATLRLALVVALVVVQSIEVSESVSLLGALKAWSLPPLCLGGLAASLGFTAARHRATSPWREVAGDRLRVVFPVYAFAILAATFALGLALTTNNRAGYLRDGRTFTYLLNLVGLPHYELPGVFEFTNVPRIVNALVWIAPIYAVLLLVACLPARNKVARLVPACLAAAVAITALVVQGLDPDWIEASDLAALAFRGDGLSVLLGGLLGMAAFHLRDRLPASALAATAAAAVLGIAALVGNPGWLASAPFRIVMAVPTAYLALFLTFRRLPLPVLSRRLEPYLAGLVLFAYPLQQAMIEVGPERQGFLVNLALALPAALVLAAGFWHLVGQRLLSQRARAALAEASAVHRGPLLDFSRARRGRRGAFVETVAIALVLGGIFIGVMALLYIAMLPE